MQAGVLAKQIGFAGKVLMAFVAQAGARARRHGTHLQEHGPRRWWTTGGHAMEDPGPGGCRRCSWLAAPMAGAP